MPSHSNSLLRKPDTDTLLRIQNLSLSFNDGFHYAFQGIDTSIQAGEFISIIGPSGCGKSTLLKTVAGLIQPTTGSLTWAQDQQPESAFIFQDPTLLPWKTALENIEVPLQLKKMSASERGPICEEAINRVLLDKFKDYYPKSLSGGMKMRVSLARAMTIHPQLLFLDEPFGALDAITRNQMNQLLLELKEQQSWTALMVTHSVNEAVYMADRVLVMTHSPGTVLTEIPIDLAHPRTEEMLMDPTYLNYVHDIRELIGKEIS